MGLNGSGKFLETRECRVNHSKQNQMQVHSLTVTQWFIILDSDKLNDSVRKDPAVPCFLIPAPKIKNYVQDQFATKHAHIIWILL